MLRVLLTQSADRPFGGLLDAAEMRDDVQIGAVVTTGSETAEAIRTREFDALVFPDDWAELCRAIRFSLGLTAGSGPTFVVGADALSKPLVLKSALYGFDGAVATEPDPNQALSALVEITHGVRRLADDPVLGELGLRAGSLAQKVAVVADGDREIVDLVAAGLPDDDIATVVGASLQHVRNRIEGILHANALSHRTQLAVLAAALWEVPDFS